MLTELFNKYGELKLLAEAFTATGTDVFLVGGPVRDLKSGLIPKDLDVTSPLRPDQFRALTARLGGVNVWDVGEAHGTTGVEFRSGVVVEHTTHRTEVYEPGSRTPTVGFGTDLAADLARRDFTLNAMALNLRTGETIDPFNGADDLAAGVLRTPADPVRTFSEDPLRILRAVRFAATRGFTVAPETAAAASEVAGRLGIISKERVLAELRRVFDSPGASTVAFKVMADLSITTDALGSFGASLVDPGSLSALTCPSEVVAALAALTPGDSEAVMRALTFGVADLKFAKAVAGASADLRDVTDPGDAVEVLALVRRHGLGTVRAALRVSPVVDANAAPLVPFPADVLAGTVESVEVHADTKVPVDGRDALAAGLKGRSVGVALTAVEAAFCKNPALSRHEALAVLASTAS